MMMMITDIMLINDSNENHDNHEMITSKEGSHKCQSRVGQLWCKVWNFLNCGSSLIWIGDTGCFFLIGTP